MAQVNVSKGSIFFIVLILIGMALAVLIVNTWVEVIGVVIAMAGAVLLFRNR
jgi:hypothetical protein